MAGGYGTGAPCAPVQSCAVWVDAAGQVRRVPQILGRLKPGKCSGHAALRAFVIARDGARCRHCGTTEDLIADHVVARSRGGSHHPDNLQALCQRCNARKGVA